MKFTIKLLLMFLTFVGIHNSFVFGQSCSGSLGDPVVNVTFGSGTNPGPALPAGQTNYIFSNATCIQDGYYGIRTSAVLNSTDNSNCYGGGWLLSTRDHTGDTNGYMMVVNASYTPGEFFKSTISGLCGGTTYEFSSWIMNLLRSGACSSNSQRFPNVTFNIETTSGTVLKTFSTGNIPENSSPQWNRYATFFKTPTGVSTVVLRLVNNAPGGCGNDLALDDIQFRACGPTLTVSPVSASLCAGSSITLTGTISAGYNNPVYQWQQSTDNGTTWTNISGATTLTLTVTPAIGATQYRVLASELGNINLVTCRIASTPTVNVNVYPYPSLVGTSASICSGTCLDLNNYWSDQNVATSGREGTVKYFNTLADAQTDINWLPSSTVCPANSRSYFVCKTLNGCSSIAEIPITVKPLPISNASVSPNSLCAGNTISFSTTATSGATYAWSGPNNFASTNQNPIITNATTAASGVYSLIVTLNGCTATSTTSVSVKPLPSVSATSNSPICAGQTLNLSGTSNGSSFVWSGPNGFTSTTQNPIIANSTPSSGGIYTLLASLNGCTATTNISVVIKNLPTATASSNSSVCVGNTLNLIAQNGIIGVTYQWNGPNNFTANSQNPNINNVSLAATGTYTLTATQSGCSVTSTTSVTINSLPTPTVNSNSPVCVGNTINLSASGGTNYLWNGVNGFTSNLQNPTIPNATLSNAGNYVVTVTNANGCSATASVNMVVNPLPTPIISSNSPICVGNAINLSASGGTNYVWSGANGFTSNLQNPSIPNATLSHAGNYVVTVTNANECSATASVNVVVNPLPTPTINSNSPVCVGNTINLSASGGTNYLWNGVNGFTSNLQNPTIPNATLSHAGNYVVTVTNANECSATASVNVVVNPLPTPSISSNSPVCVGNSINLSASGGTNYAWNGANGFTSNLQNTSILNASLSNAGNYLVTVTNANGCSATASVNIIIKSLPTATASSNSSVCVGNTLNLIAQNGVIGVTYQWNGPNNFTANSQNPSINNVSLAANGTYTLTATQSGCSTTSTTSVAINPLPTPTVNSNSPVCIGNTINLSASGGTNYVWSGANGFTSNLQNPTISNATLSNAGNYTVTVTNANGCSATTSVNVVVNPLPTPTINSNSPVCVENTINLSASGGTNYIWSGVNGFTSNLQNPMIPNATISNAGNYIVTVTNANGCSATTSVNVVVNPLPTPTINSNSPICVGNTINLSASGGTNYIWSGANGFTSNLQNPTISNATLSNAGNYTVTVTNANGCSATASVNVVVNPLPTPTINSNSPVCVGNSIILSASGGTNYAWSGVNGFTSNLQNPSIPNASLSNAGNYLVTVTNANGCSATASVNVVVNPPPTPTINSNSPVCVGNTINLSTSGGINYIWNGANGFTSNLQNPIIPNATISNAGNYNVTVTNANGCSATTSVNMVVNPLPTPTVNSNYPVCVGNTINLSASGGINYLWNGANGFTSNLQNPIIPNATISNAGNYNVTVTNANGCSATASVNIIIKSLPTATASSNSPVCVGNTLNLIAQNGVIGVTYQWNGPNNFTANSQNPSINNVSLAANGTYTLTATQSGCSTTSTTSVAINPLPTPTVNSNSPVCIGNTINLSASGGTNYVWSGANGFTSNLQNPSIPNATLSNAGNYSVTVTNANGCSATASVNVVVNSLPTPTINSNSPVCVGNSINLSASGETNYIWSGVNGFTSNIQNPSILNASLSNAGNYIVTITNANGCSATASVNVVVNPLPTPSISSNSPVCVGNTINLSSSGGVNYLWNGANGFTSNLQNPIISIATLSNAGNYLVTVTNFNGCSSTASVNVVVNENPLAEITVSTPICEDEKLIFHASIAGFGANYLWSGPNNFSSTLQNPTIEQSKPSDSGNYSLSVLLNGCLSTDTVSVLVKPKPLVSIQSNAPICETETLNLTATGTSGVSYEWSASNGFTSNVQNPIIQNTSISNGGIYSITVNLAGCTNTASTNVVIHPKPIALASSSSPICENENLNITTMDAGINAIYDWGGPNGFNSNQQLITLNNASVNLSGIYSLTVTLGNCSSTSTTEVIVYPKPTLTIDSIRCDPSLKTFHIRLKSSGGVVSSTEGIITHLGNDEYLISGINSITNTTISVISDKNCSISIPITAPNCNCPLINAPLSGGNQIICEGEATPVLSTTVSLNETVDWYDSMTGGNILLSSSTTFTPSQTNAGEYKFYAQTRNTINDCISNTRTEVVFTIKPTPKLTINSNSPICEDDTLKLFSNSDLSGVSYAWNSSNGFTSNIQNPTIISTNLSLSGYYVSTTNLNGCIDTDSVLVSIKPKPTVNITTNSPVCEGFSLFLSGNETNGANYRWEGPQNFTSNTRIDTLKNVVPSQSGNYILNVSLNGCTNSDTTQVIINSKPKISIETPTCAINLATYSFKFNAIGGSVTASDGVISGDSIKNIDAGKNVKLIITSPEGCSDSLFVNAPNCFCPVISAPVSNEDTSICENQSIPLLSAKVDTLNNETIDWYDAPTGGTLLQTASLNYQPTQVTPNTYIFYAETRRKDITIQTCTSSTRTPIKLIIKPLPNITISNNSPICEKDTLKLQANSVAHASYSWVSDNGFSSTSITPVRTSVIPSMSGIYTLTIGLNGCTNTATTSVLIKPLPVPKAISDAFVCENDTISLKADDAGIGAIYGWTGTNNFSSIEQNPKIFPAKTFNSGKYKLSVSLNGCSAEDSLEILVKPLPTINISSNTPICSNDTLKIFSGNSDSGAIYEWSGPNGFTSNKSNLIIPEAQPTMNGFYKLFVSTNGCRAADSISVKIKPLPIAMPSATKDSICVGENIDLKAFDAGNGASYEWNGVHNFYSIEQNPIISSASTANSGNYILKTTLEGCSSSDTIQIVVSEKPFISVDSATCSPDLKTFQIFFKNSIGSLVSASAGIVNSNIISAIPADSASVTIRVFYPSGCYTETIVNKPDCNCKVIEAPISLGDTSYCEGNTIPNLKVKVGSFQTADWYDAPTGGIKLFTGLNYLPAKADTFYVEARDTVSQCKSITRTRIILNISNLPNFKLNSISGSCLGNIPQNNGKILISDVINGEKFDIIRDTVYSGNQTFSTATQIPANGILLEKLPNSPSDIIYTVRVFNEFGCFTDKQISLKASVCLCPETICVPFKITQTKSKRQ